MASITKMKNTKIHRYHTTWQPNFDKVPVPVLSSFWVPLDIISSTNFRYIYSSCLSKIIFGRKVNLSTSNLLESLLLEA